MFSGSARRRRWSAAASYRSLPPDCVHVGEVFSGGTFLDVVDGVGIDILSIDLARRAHAGGRTHCEPARTCTHVGNNLPRHDIKQVHHAIHVKFLIAVSILEGGEIALVWGAGGPLRLRL